MPNKVAAALRDIKGLLSGSALIGCAASLERILQVAFGQLGWGQLCFKPRLEVSLRPHKKAFTKSSGSWESVGFDPVIDRASGDASPLDNV